MRLIVAVGARPNVVKAAPLLPELAAAGIEAEVAFTGSRATARDDGRGGSPSFYGVEMPAPTWYLDVGADTIAVQTGRALTAFEELFARQRPDAALVIGDVNSTLAAALAAAHAGIPVAHLGAGLRCGDPMLPEEINRLLVSRISALHLAPSEEAVENLVSEGIEEDRIHFVGNMMAESVLKHLDEIKREDPARRFELERYVLASFHRDENIGDKERLERLLGALGGIELPIVMPDVSDIGGLLAEFGLRLPPNIRLIDVVPYSMMLALERDAECIVTDSGGVQEEACIICTPCVTVRRCTEHAATLKYGGNRLSTANRDMLRAAVSGALEVKRSWPRPHRWDKAVSDRVARVLKRGVPRLT